MRNMATLTAVASVLAIGMATANAAPLVPNVGVGNSDSLLQKIQGGGEQKGPGTPTPGARGREDGGKGGGPGAMQGGDRGKGADRGFRGGDRGGDRADRRGRVDIDGDRNRDRRRRAGGRGGVDIYVGPGSYGYGPGCGWLRRRALDTGSSYWWRRYRACIGGY
jgi:hypothetical protein